MPSVRTSAGPNWATKMAPEMPQPKSSHPGQAEYHSDHKQGPWGVRSASFKRQHLLGVTLRDFERKLYHCQRWFSNQRRQPTVASSYLLSGAANGLQRCLQTEKNLDFHEDVVMAEGREHNGRRLLGSERTATQLFWLDQRLDHLCGTDVYTYILSSILSQNTDTEGEGAECECVFSAGLTCHIENVFVGPTLLSLCSFFLFYNISICEWNTSSWDGVRCFILKITYRHCCSLGCNAALSWKKKPKVK